MAATKADAPNATPALNFDVIEKRAEDLGIESLPDYLGVHHTTIWRWRNGLTVPDFEVLCDVAAKLRLSLDEITPKGNPTAPPPSGPSSPPPPPGPKAGQR
jgi:transcriptional regulator with XRE-family HTH domain